MHKYYPDMYLILYCMTCFIVLYLIYVIYHACRFEKLLRAYVDCYKMYPLKPEIKLYFVHKFTYYDKLTGNYKDLCAS
jgi:hypothetical protein